MSDEPLSFTEHFQELRKALLKALFFLAIGFAICLPLSSSFFSLFFHTLQPKMIEKSVVEVLRNPSNQTTTYTLAEGEAVLEKDLSIEERQGVLLLPPQSKALLTRKEPSFQLIALSPLDGVSVLLKVSFLAGSLVSFPFWAGALLNFVLPALHREEKRFAKSFFLLSFLFLLLGLLFGYLILIPLCQSALLSLNSAIALNRWALLPYFDFCLMLLFASCLSFQAWAAILLLIRAGVFSYRQLKNARKGVILGSFIVGALLTPPDVLSQLVVALPLIGMFEFSLLFARASKL